MRPSEIKNIVLAGLAQATQPFRRDRSGMESMLAAASDYFSAKTGKPVALGFADLVSIATAHFRNTEAGNFSTNDLLSAFAATLEGKPEAEIIPPRLAEAVPQMRQYFRLETEKLKAAKTPAPPRIPQSAPSIPAPEPAPEPITPRRPQWDVERPAATAPAAHRGNVALLKYLATGIFGAGAVKAALTRPIEHAVDMSKPAGSVHNEMQRTSARTQLQERINKEQAQQDATAAAHDLKVLKQMFFRAHIAIPGVDFSDCGRPGPCSLTPAQHKVACEMAKEFFAVLKGQNQFSASPTARSAREYALEAGIPIVAE